MSRTKPTYTGYTSAKRVRAKCKYLTELLDEVFDGKHTDQSLSVLEKRRLLGEAEAHLKWMRTYYKDMKAEILDNKAPPT